MSPAGSVTHRISLLKAGDQRAARQLWENYFRRLVRLARQTSGAPSCGGFKAFWEQEDVW
jgi:hypothetical protein